MASRSPARLPGHGGPADPGRIRRLSASAGLGRERQGHAGHCRAALQIPASRQAAGDGRGHCRGMGRGRGGISALDRRGSVPGVAARSGQPPGSPPGGIPEPMRLVGPGGPAAARPASALPGIASSARSAENAFGEGSRCPGRTPECRTEGRARALRGDQGPSGGGRQVARQGCRCPPAPPQRDCRRAVGCRLGGDRGNAAGPLSRRCRRRLGGRYPGRHRPPGDGCCPRPPPRPGGDGRAALSAAAGRGCPGGAWRHAASA